MEIEVYDTYARSEEGLKIHFDVMLPIGGDEATAQDKAREFIEKISETANPVQLEQPVWLPNFKNIQRGNQPDQGWRG